MKVVDIKKAIFLVTLALLLLVSASAQSGKNIYPSFFADALRHYKATKTQYTRKPIIFDESKPFKGISPFLPDYHVRHLVWTCRQEYRFERMSGLALRLRLGSLGYTNWLEGKSH